MAPGDYGAGFLSLFESLTNLAEKWPILSELASDKSPRPGADFSAQQGSGRPPAWALRPATEGFAL